MKPWTDWELGFLQDNEGSLTHREIADELNRSENSIKKKLFKMRHGQYTIGDMRPWTNDDDAVVCSVRPAADIAAELGRTIGSVNARRRRLQADGRVQKFAGKWNALEPGARPLIARTCPECGLLLQALWFASNKKGFRKTCKRCIADSAMTHETRSKWLRKAGSVHARLQAISLASATNAGKEWTEPDYDVLRDPDLTILQKALKLNRTYSGTAQACARIGAYSRNALGDPERDQWMIQNPQAAKFLPTKATVAA